MAKEKSLLFLVVVVVLVGIAAGFLYWKNNQQETIAPNNFSDPQIPPPDIDKQSEFSSVGPYPPDVSDIPKEPIEAIGE